MSKKPQYDPEEIRFPDQKIETSYLVHEMEQSYIEYAMSVIVGRRCPTCGRPEAGPPAHSLRHV